jgi:hypothetical protein
VTVTRLRPCSAIGGHRPRTARAHGIQCIDGTGLIAHGQSVKRLLDSSETRLEVTDRGCLKCLVGLGIGKRLLHSLELRRVLGQGRGVHTHLPV